MVYPEQHANNDPVARKARPRPPLATIFQAGLLAGTLDILAAFISYYVKTGKGPSGVLVYVASGVFGKEAFAGGAVMASWGLVFHYIIAFAWAALFFLLWPVLQRYVKHWAVAGLLYGVFVWCAMNLVIVPLSQAPTGPFRFWGVVQGMGILMVCIGLPMAWVVRRSRGDSDLSNQSDLTYLIYSGFVDKI